MEQKTSKHLPILFCFNLPGEVVRFWILCSSDRGDAKKEVTCWYTILDGTRSYIKKTLWY